MLRQEDSQSVKPTAVTELIKAVPTDKNTITSFNLVGETPWSHCAMQVGASYVSIYPSTHFTPPAAHDEIILDPSDYAPQIHAFVVNTRTMVNSKIGLATVLELNQYP